MLSDEQYQAAIKVAAQTYRRHMSSARGQIVTPADSYEWHIAQAVAEAAVEAEREACAKLCENMYRRDLVQFAPEYTAADEIAQEIRARGDCATPPAAPVPEQASAAVPENMAVVPRTMVLKPEAMEALQFILGGCELDNDEAPLDERWLSGILFVGEVADDDGKVVHGLHVYSEDYPEEGSVTLVEFAASQPEVKS